MLQAQIYIDKDELKGAQPLYEFIMLFLAKHKIMGATAFSGEIGFGQKQKMKRPDAWFSFDEPPMLITFIDEEKKVRAALTALRKEYKGGFITISQVEQWK